MDKEENAEKDKGPSTSKRKSKTEDRKHKYVNPRVDRLTLECEWDECHEYYDEMNGFLNHITSHLKDFLPPVKEFVEGTAPDTHTCQWRHCDQEHDDVLEFMRHVYFHAFHTKLKSTGQTVMSRAGLGQCLLHPSSRNLVPEVPERLQCSWDNCDGIYDNPYAFYEHVANHVEVHCPRGQNVKNGCKCLWEGCDMVVRNKTRLKEHLRCHTQEKQVACPTCGSLFASNTKFYDHIKRQNEGDAECYLCTHCGKQFGTERLLKDHVHQHVNYYKCPYCSMTCPTPAACRHHIKYKHMDTKPFHCPECDHKAKTVNDLKKHMDKHSQTTYACHLQGCDYTCVTYNSLTAHYRNRHQVGLVPTPEQNTAEAEKRYYACHLCSVQCNTGAKLTNHFMKKHKLKRPPGHSRFRYKLHDDGLFRLQTMRYESVGLRHPGNDQSESLDEPSSPAESGPGSVSSEAGEATNTARQSAVSEAGEASNTARQSAVSEAGEGTETVRPEPEQILSMPSLGALTGETPQRKRTASGTIKSTKPASSVESTANTDLPQENIQSRVAEPEKTDSLCPEGETRKIIVVNQTDEPENTTDSDNSPGPCSPSADVNYSYNLDLLGDVALHMPHGEDQATANILTSTPTKAPDRGTDTCLSDLISSPRRGFLNLESSWSGQGHSQGQKHTEGHYSQDKDNSPKAHYFLPHSFLTLPHMHPSQGHVDECETNTVSHVEAEPASTRSTFTGLPSQIITYSRSPVKEGCGTLCGTNDEDIIVIQPSANL